MSARPFLKWVGGKTQLLPELRKFFPPKGSYGTYHEPFLGGGAVFFDLAPSRACLADANAELITTYRAVRTELSSVLRLLRMHDAAHRRGLHPDVYYQSVRASRPVLSSEIAARMIYLNKTCFNGLYRVNRKGEFNVPPGKYANPMICDEANLQACAGALAVAAIDVADFRELPSTTNDGDFVYFDPPYVPVSRTANFTGYTAGGFDQSAQRSLVAIMHKLDERGCLLLLSNADTPETRELYKGFRITAVEARRNVNNVGTKRGKVGEIIVCNESLWRPAERGRRHDPT